MVRPAAVAMRVTELAGSSLVFYGGFQLEDASFEFLFFGGGKVVASAVAVAVVTSGRRESGL